MSRIDNIFKKYIPIIFKDDVINLKQELLSYLLSELPKEVKHRKFEPDDVAYGIIEGKNEMLSEVTEVIKRVLGN